VGQRTSHVLEALAVQLADGDVFFLEGADAARQRIRDVQVVAGL
jgi:predicted metal-dependent hydrolase